MIINYVVSIGFGKRWGRFPSYLSAIVMIPFASNSWFIFGTPDRALPGAVLWGWLFYFYAHLGLSFILSAMIATPGCEIRSRSCSAD